MPGPAIQAGMSAMVIDASNGRTLFASQEDRLRHPASITKVMTLYLLFEQMERGRFTLDSEIPISEHAASQPPTKLGLRPGDTIRVEDAIKAIVTESANDIAVAVAEAVGGSEGNFANLMTQKARALGMSHTTYVNASGLPDDRQLTTARDLIVLGRMIQERFPRQYAFFSTRVFYYDGRAHNNHNHLLSQIEGMDGIKTGYTRSSGFNLLTSVRRDGRHIISVVLGGPTAGIRDRTMAELIGRDLQIASIGNRDAQARVQVADASEDAPPPAREAPREVAPPQRGPLVLTPNVVPAPRPRFAVVSGTPRNINPNGDETGSIDTGGGNRRRIVMDGSTRTPASAIGYTSTTPQTLRWIAGPAPAGRLGTQRSLDTRVARAEIVAPNQRDDEAPMPVAKIPTRAEAIRTAPTRTPANATAPEMPSHSGWIIQIGATDDAAKANDLLARARQRYQGALGSARPVMQKVQKGDQTLYRARFAGLEPDKAEATCRLMKRSGFDCFATKD